MTLVAACQGTCNGTNDPTDPRSCAYDPDAASLAEERDASVGVVEADFQELDGKAILVVGDSRPELVIVNKGGVPIGYGRGFPSTTLIRDRSQTAVSIRTKCS